MKISSKINKEFKSRETMTYTRAANLLSDLLGWEEYYKSDSISLFTIRNRIDDFNEYIRENKPKGIEEILYTLSKIDFYRIFYFLIVHFYRDPNFEEMDTKKAMEKISREIASLNNYIHECSLEKNIRFENRFGNQIFYNMDIQILKHITRENIKGNWNKPFYKEWPVTKFISQFKKKIKDNPFFRLTCKTDISYPNNDSNISEKTFPASYAEIFSSSIRIMIINDLSSDEMEKEDIDCSWFMRLKIIDKDKGNKYIGDYHYLYEDTDEDHNKVEANCEFSDGCLIIQAIYNEDDRDENIKLIIYPEESEIFDNYAISKKAFKNTK